MAELSSSKESKEVMNRTFSLMSDDPGMGPKLRDADTPPRFEFTDLDLVVNIRAGAPDEPNLVWEWSGGDVKAALALSPITKPLYERYRAMIAADYPHLEL